MKNIFKKTNIICTIGPSSENLLEELINAGMNVARINFSHGGKEEQKEKVEKFKKIREKLGVSVSLLMDTKGPEVRVGELEKEFEDGFKLENGNILILTPEEVLGNPERISITYKDLYKDIKKGDMVLIDDRKKYIKSC